MFLGKGTNMKNLKSTGTVLALAAAAAFTLLPATSMAGTTTNASQPAKNGCKAAQNSCKTQNKCKSTNSCNNKSN